MECFVVEQKLSNFLNDFSLRELQIDSSLVFTFHNATNNFIKQFKADHDSVQFYKNVIAWYIKKHGHLPSES